MLASIKQHRYADALHTTMDKVPQAFSTRLGHMLLARHASAGSGLLAPSCNSAIIHMLSEIGIPTVLVHTSITRTAVRILGSELLQRQGALLVVHCTGIVGDQFIA